MSQVLLLMAALLQPPAASADRAEASVESSDTKTSAAEAERRADIRARYKQRLLETVDPALLDLCSERSFRYTGRGYRDREFHYRLFVPVVAGPADKRPLLLWLHGKGEAGEDNIRQLTHLGQLVFPPPRERSRFPFFLLAVQCPSDNPVWTTGAEDADDMLHVAMAILDQTLREQPVDVERVSLSGVSSGGGGCWELALRRPDLFSAVAPLASRGAATKKLDRLVGVPVWAFHSTRDAGTPVEGVRGTVSALQDAGGTVQLTEIDTHRHDCWHPAFEAYGLLSWLLSQKRGDTAVQPPGSRLLRGHLLMAWRRLATGWTPTQLLAQLGIPVLLLAAWWSANRKRRIRRRKTLENSNTSDTIAPRGNAG